MSTQNKTKTKDGVEYVSYPKPSDKSLFYHIPVKYSKEMKISTIIRMMIADGWSATKVSNFTGIRYQHINHVLKGTESGVSGFTE